MNGLGSGRAQQTLGMQSQGKGPQKQFKEQNLRMKSKNGLRYMFLWVFTWNGVLSSLRQLSGKTVACLGETVALDKANINVDHSTVTVTFASRPQARRLALPARDEAGRDYWIASL